MRSTSFIQRSNLVSSYFTMMGKIVCVSCTCQRDRAVDVDHGKVTRFLDRFVDVGRQYVGHVRIEKLE